MLHEVSAPHSEGLKLVATHTTFDPLMDCLPRHRWINVLAGLFDAVVVAHGAVCGPVFLDRAAHTKTSQRIAEVHDCQLYHTRVKRATGFDSFVATFPRFRHETKLRSPDDVTAMRASRIPRGARGDSAGPSRMSTAHGREKELSYRTPCRMLAENGRSECHRTSARWPYTIVNITRRQCKLAPGRAVWHTLAMDHAASQTPDYRDARHPTRVYSGSIADGLRVVTVLDSAIATGADNPRTLDAPVSRAVKDCCCTFDWGQESPGARQVAVALLLDVSGDAATAVRWHERFAQTYVSKLGPSWTVPEIDIALWLYCFDNARPGS